jgi:ATP-binding cassette subfamily B protein RaxB
MGTVLSGGQKQRVLLARALYKRPGILILDEATSQLDIEKEREVNAALKALKITRIIVAHRPETIAAANHILVLHDGTIMSDTTRPTGPMLAARAELTADGRPKQPLPRAPAFMRFPPAQT